MLPLHLEWMEWHFPHLALVLYRWWPEFSEVKLLPSINTLRKEDHKCTQSAAGTGSSSHLSGSEEGWDGRNGIRRWQLLGHPSCGWGWHNRQGFLFLPFGAGFAVRSFKGSQHSQLYIDKRTKSKCQGTLSNQSDLGRHNHTWNTFTVHTERHFNPCTWLGKLTKTKSAPWFENFRFRLQPKQAVPLFQGMSIFLLPENDKQA